MNKTLLIIRLFGYLVIGFSFDKQGISLVYIVVLALVMEVVFFINRLVEKNKLSKESREKVEDMINDIDIKIK